MIDFPQEPNHVNPSRGKFPPAKGNQPVKPVYQTTETGAVSTGSGGITKTLGVKRAGIRPSPGREKNVNLS